jgi:heavy metal translocating P-type ATPase
MPIYKSTGSTVFAGTLNETGRFVMEATTEPEDTIVAQIIKLVNAASIHKAPIQRTVDTFTAWYLPIILFVAGIGYWVTKTIHDAVSILLVAAPCALAIGTPTAVSAAMANMAKKGVLLKGGNTLEQAGKIDTMMIDKTGTLTVGTPAFFDVISMCQVSEDEILRIAASVEKHSDHPFAKAIQEEAKKRNIFLYEVDDFISVTAMGVKGNIQGKSVLIGKNDWVKAQMPKAAPLVSDSKASVAVAMDGHYLGEILFVDTLRPDAKEAVHALKDLLGNESLAVLSGDQKKQASLTGEAIGISVTYGDLMPVDKEQLIYEKRRQGHKVAMIGDGINDAPALAAADIGIAMGVCGTKFAAETADVVLMRENLSLIAEFMKLSRVVVRRIKLNIFFSIIFNLVGIILGYFGLLNPVLAIILQEAATMTVLVSSAMLISWNSGFSSNKADMTAIHMSS